GMGGGPPRLRFRAAAGHGFRSRSRPVERGDRATACSAPGESRPGLAHCRCYSGGVGGAACRCGSSGRMITPELDRLPDSLRASVSCETADLFERYMALMLTENEQQNLI